MFLKSPGDSLLPGFVGALFPAAAAQFCVSEMKVCPTLFLVVVVSLFCRSVLAGMLEGKTNPIVSISAKGWSIKPGPPANGASNGSPTTIVVTPKGDQVNIGETPYPDILTATLWIVEVKELKARFLLIRVPPGASAAVETPILYIGTHDKASLAGKVLQRFEFEADPDDEPGFDPKVRWDGEHRLRDLLFEDSDGDGIPELVENDIWKEGGTRTYFRFTEQKTFVPLWKEEWKLRLDNHALERVYRTKVENAKR